MLNFLPRFFGLTAFLLLAACLTPKGAENSADAGLGITVAEVEAIVEENRGNVPWQIEKSGDGIVVKLEFGRQLYVFDLQGHDGQLRSMIYGDYLLDYDRSVPDDTNENRSEIDVSGINRSHFRIRDALWQGIFEYDVFERWQRRMLRGEYGRRAPGGYVERRDRIEISLFGDAHIRVIYVTNEPDCYGLMASGQTKPSQERIDRCAGPMKWLNGG